MILLISLIIACVAIALDAQDSTLGGTVPPPIATSDSSAKQGQFGNGCSDLFTLCPSWQGAGECVNNPIWMLDNCPAACIECGAKNVVISACIDNNSECAAWALDGECGQNAGYMLWKCPKACGWCQMAGVIAYPVQVKKFVDSTPIKLRELS